MNLDPSLVSIASRPLPTREQLAALDVTGFLARLDHAGVAIEQRASLDALIPPDDARVLVLDPRPGEIDSLLRRTLRGIMVVSSLGDLPDAARVHPAVQHRVRTALDDLDASLSGLGDALAALDPTERRAVTRAMREEPEIAASILTALDAQAYRAGVSDERRAHLQRLGQQACFRLRQSTAGFIDEYTDKLRRARPRDAEMAERWLALQSGHATFAEERAWQIAVAERWDALLAAPPSGGHPEGPPGSIYRPLPPPPPPPPRRGTPQLKSAGVLFGLGLITGATGGALLSSGRSDWSITGLFALTGAAVFTVAGAICLLIGVILRLRDRR